jgi:FAD/FMN-containing dehydrogenase
MVIFNIGNKQIKYNYPETAADITLEQYIYFAKFLLPEHPKTELEAIQYMNDRDAVYQKIIPYAKKLKVTTKNILQFTVIIEIEDILKNQEVKDNVRRFLPPLMTQWRTNDEQLNQRLEIMDEVWEARERYPYMAKVVNYFTGIPLDACFGKVADSLELKYLVYIYSKIMNAINTPAETKYKQLYDFNGKVYTLPERLMEKSTLLEFTMAAQYDKAMNQVKNGDPQGLLNIMAVLLKPLGEDYSDELFEQNKVDFLQMSLQTSYEVAFFLTKLSEKFTLDLQTSMLERAMENLN